MPSAPSEHWLLQDNPYSPACRECPFSREDTSASQASGQEGWPHSILEPQDCGLKFICTKDA